MHTLINRATDGRPLFVACLWVGAAFVTHLDAIIAAVLRVWASL